MSDLHQRADEDAIGIVNTQAGRMFPATPQRTAETLVAPAPRTLPEIVCVVRGGRSARVRQDPAHAVWAAKP